MQIQKVLNNNVVIALDETGEETVLMGRGLGFGRHTGDSAPAHLIEKRFTLHAGQLSDRFQQLLTSIPLPHFLLSERIIDHAKHTLSAALSDSIYVTLPDHISAAIERHKQNIELSNPLLWDIRQFYPEEYRAGCAAVDLIREETGIDFAEDEAGFIAMHFVNAEGGGELPEVYDMTCLMQRVFGLIREQFGVEPEHDSLDFCRFVAHLKFLARRIAAGQRYGDRDADLLPPVQHKYPAAFACAQMICGAILQEYDFDAGKSELLYLTLHIARITGT
ncbi:BglG family transcription antiterminator LicT [Candidatus Agathobaculum pullicola]|uniref:BglG family transcription antiterminator LicT n=1 Tax=Candidatus Agathobaculum pullicola TaxID=2838426 RepID=UPI003F8F06CC